MSATIKHSLIVPCYNEEDNVAAFLSAAVTAMDGYTADYEIVFINDGSTDRTQQELDRLFDEHPQLHLQIIRFSRNFGKEAAMLAGLRAAVGEYVTIIDADLQQRPEIAVKMGRLLDEKPEIDMVAAYQDGRKESRYIEWCKESFYKVLNRITEVEIIPDASDFRTLRRPVVEAVLSMTEYHRFSKGIFSWVGYTTESIPYEVQERKAGQTKWGFWKLLRYAANGIVAYTEVPLKWPVFMSIVMLIGAALTAIVSLVLLLCGQAVPASAWVAALLLLLTAVLSFSQGVLGLYIGKIHTQVKQRPVYIVKEKRSYEQD